jgi:ribosome-associated protein
VVKLTSLIQQALEDGKAEDVTVIDLAGKCDFADSMIVASGNSHRHVHSIANRVTDAMKAAGEMPLSVEGEELCDWVLIDAGDVIVHIFRPETRHFYNLEKMWAIDIPTEMPAMQETVIQ